MFVTNTCDTGMHVWAWAFPIEPRDAAMGTGIKGMCLHPGGLEPTACEQPALQRRGRQAACTLDRRPQDSRKSGQVWDNPVLGAWVHRLRRDYRKNTLPQWQVDLLDRLDFAWKVDVHSAKWHHNLHEARRYKVRRRSCVGGGLFMLLHMGPVLGRNSPRDSGAS